MIFDCNLHVTHHKNASDLLGTGEVWVMNLGFGYGLWVITGLWVIPGNGVGGC